MLLAGSKGNGFRLVSLFSLPFCPQPAGKGNIFWLFSLFSLPFLLLAGSKGNGFRWVSLFSLPFCPQPDGERQHILALSPFYVAFFASCRRNPDKSNPFPSFSLFSLLFKPYFLLPLSPHFPSALKRSRSFLVRD